MTNHVSTENAKTPVTATLPTPAPTVYPAPAPVIDHVHRHAVKCYWDFMECRWQCSDE